MQPADSDIEEEEEVDFENDVAYEPEIEGLLIDMRQLLTRLQQVDLGVEEDDEQDMGWDFDAPALPPGAIRARHDHHHHGQIRGFGGMFDMLGSGDAFRRESVDRCCCNDVFTNID